MIDYSELGYYVFTDEVKRPAFNITAGITYQMGWNLFGFTGVGYGQNKLYWNIDEYRSV